jgi:hypothetical protein
MHLNLASRLILFLQVALDMSWNNLTSLSGVPNQTGNYARIFELNLSHNQISGFKMEELPANLTKLFLDFNSVEVLKNDVLDSLAKMEKLRLGHNPYKCTCEAHDLYEFIEVSFTESKFW